MEPPTALSVPDTVPTVAGTSTSRSFATDSAAPSVPGTWRVGTSSSAPRPSSDTRIVGSATLA